MVENHSQEAVTAFAHSIRGSKLASTAGVGTQLEMIADFCPQ
ncbi:MAG: hypothetical protein P5683_24130 [Limnospira sp. PMC 1279.21]|uniref:Uncharacterized protein n=2 Tax=Limnospira TaxID=2596745 RepID=A0A9P1KBD4_9CYAN|nr:MULTISPECIES: hypothetical protein [Limnospira]MDT9180233.1 hypothetical protein [Limnospira sp. PMC 1238.20]MDT9201161.1 hypothetical protein [Limnospira sp. PMC 1042.18]MDT9220176.1 hypothetical protein [Limnospira sp. PMC 1240.20]MDT9226327.1 hypothetical protein [Limnospira sp. PMC 1279.21]MDT9251812.1 hypothetical protein [Limnospira sp. PMC 1280.21]MDT9288019.1 hypothetical protein [Limnospira sp. PMC 1298.21]UWU50972.1 hypothetical protein APLC1_5920 [Arthrospira platensis C1]CDM9